MPLRRPGGDVARLRSPTISPSWQGLATKTAEGLKNTPRFLEAEAGQVLDAAKAAQLGWLWLLSRAIYPFVFAKGPPLLFVSTLPGYGFIGALLWPVGALAFA